MWVPLRGWIGYVVLGICFGSASPEKCTFDFKAKRAKHRLRKFSVGRGSRVVQRLALGRTSAKWFVALGVGN